MQTNTQTPMQNAAIDVMLRKSVITTLRHAHYKLSVPNFEDFQKWCMENKEDIESSISFHLRLAKRKKKQLTIH